MSQDSNTPNVNAKYSKYIESRKRNTAKESKTSSGTIAFIIVLICVTIGAFYFLTRNKTEPESEDEESQIVQEEDNQTEEENQDVEDGDTEVDVKDKKGDDAAEGENNDENFSSEEQTVGDEQISGVTVTDLDQEGFESFLRISFTIDSDEVPYASASLLSESNLISLKIKGVDNDSSGLNTGNAIDVSGSVVSSIFHEVTSEEDTTRYSIGIREQTSFYLHSLDDPKRIVMDVKEVEVEESDVPEFSFSTGAQSVTGNADGNVVTISGLSYSSQGSVYRIIFRLGTIGSGTIPEVKATNMEYDGGNAIKLLISKVYSDFAAENGFDETFDDTRVFGMTGSFESNVSTYFIKTSGERNYKLYYREAPAQLIVDIK